MGAKIEVNVVSEKFIDILSLLKVINTGFNNTIMIKNLEVMDDWDYNNVMNISDSSLIKDFILQDKILCIELSEDSGLDVGMYIESEDNLIIYNLWFDIFNYAALDIDVINQDNIKYYDKIYETIDILNRANNDCIKLAAIGVETKFEYNKHLHLLISNSYNVNAWIVSKKTNININGFTEKVAENISMKVFEKIYI